MERENYYILLDLSIDPPETDTKVIEAAIARKQSEWSRHRNHPTKGLQAQQYISMIPDIRRVMTDPARREQEAAAAKTHTARDKAGKISEIDRHIDILMGKGFISREEIVKLARRHGLEEKDIQDRVRLKKDEKFARVDQQLSLRMAKGYITEEEIKKLAQRHNLKVDEVKSRVYIPMLKNGPEKDAPEQRQMDRSLEKSIRENLKIIEKKSLYDFLGLHESADLETLKDAISRKKKELAGAGKKDAQVTAGNTLAGHCATIFRNEESRIAYDISLAKSRLAELDSDIDISGFNGQIRREYYEILLQKAMDFGMEEQEAERYIQDYCKRKNWTIEPPKGDKRRFVIIGAVFGILLIIAAAGGFFYVNHSRQQAMEEAYAALEAQVAAEDDYQDGINRIRQYILEHQEEKGYGELVENARELLGKQQDRLNEKRYDKASSAAETHAREKDYEAARAALRDYLDYGPPDAYANRAEQALAEIDATVEQADFKALSEIVVEGNAGEKIDAITRYLENHPEGRHSGEVEEMLADMSNEYFIYVQNVLEDAEAREDWETCAQTAENYIVLYDNAHADRLKTRLERYRQEIRQGRIFAALQQKARRMGEDYDRARRVYTDYLAAYPDTPLEEEIEEAIRRVDERQADARLETARGEILGKLQEAGNRFSEAEAGVVEDSRTGLMWTLIDSSTGGPANCMAFEGAQDYAESLETGGYSDWRLPTPEELASLYKTDPPFPVFEEKLYWSRNSYSGYSEGWYRIVEVLAVHPEHGARGGRMDSRECGVVRAVRER